MLEAGRALRAQVPRRSHGRWTPSPGRPDPLEILSGSNATRLPELVPVRNGRMMASPFAYYRGSPAVMAADLSRTPSTGIELQLCGDAHLQNFGIFATPERNQVFDLNDFDETQPGPWEWDVKRLAASLMVAARTSGLSDGDGRAAVQSCSTEFRKEIAKMAQLSAFEVWHSRLDVESIIAAAPDKPTRSRAEKTAAKARQRTSLRALSKLTTVRGGHRVIVEDPPVVVRLSDAQLEQARGFVQAYLATLDPDRDLLLDRYEFVDAALKVVGVGSVGTRCFVVLLAGKADLDPLFLQVKEAQPSVLAPYVGGSRYANQGKRVVVGQRIMQAASDVFLGWARAGEFDTYVRQLRDMKGSVALDDARPEGLRLYGRLCGAALARAHARAGQPALLAGYLGKSTAFDDSLAAFAVSYADQNDRDYKSFLDAIRSGRIPAEPGR
jgi:uncharacterized protein (DUF2252 family)